MDTQQQQQDGSILLRAIGIKKSFMKGKTEIPVIRGVDFAIRLGEMVAITGASGVGKSTLLHILGTLEPPSAGQVLFGQSRQDIFKYTERALSLFRNRALGFVFQFHYLLPEFTALENVMMPALIAGHARAAAESQAKELLGFVGMGHRLEHRPAELSGGEQQRVALARAIVSNPAVLLADEPTGNLDEATSLEMLRLLRKVADDGALVVVATHDRALLRAGGRRLHLVDGRMLERPRIATRAS